MLYVTTHSTHFIYGYMASKLISNSLQQHLLNSFKEGRKEGNALCNDTLNTFYLWLYGIKTYFKQSTTAFTQFR